MRVPPIRPMSRAAGLASEVYALQALLQRLNVPGHLVDRAIEQAGGSPRLEPQPFIGRSDTRSMARKGRKITRKQDSAKFACPHCGKTVQVSIAARKAPGTAGD